MFGTDAEENVYQFFQDVLSNVDRLWRDIYTEKNVFKKMTEFGVCKGNKQEITNNIFV